jgi:hypothetical protein
MEVIPMDVVILQKHQMRETDLSLNLAVSLPEVLLELAELILIFLFVEVHHLLHILYRYQDIIVFLDLEKDLHHIFLPGLFQLFGFFGLLELIAHKMEENFPSLIKVLFKRSLLSAWKSPFFCTMICASCPQKSASRFFKLACRAVSVVSIARATAVR